jgi:hypothetical protein
MKSHGSVRVVRMWCGTHANPILRCLDDLEGLNNGHLPSGRAPRVRQLANGLRLDTIVPSQDLSRPCITICG